MGRISCSCFHSVFAALRLGVNLRAFALKQGTSEESQTRPSVFPAPLKAKGAHFEKIFGRGIFGRGMGKCISKISMPNIPLPLNPFSFWLRHVPR
jgi:hypothetical protein